MVFTTKAPRGRKNRSPWCPWWFTPRVSVRGEIAIEEGGGRLGAVDPVRQPDEAVPLIFVADVLDRPTQRLQRLDDLLGFADRHARVVRAMEDEQRRDD